jgi:hypothetical protein
MVLLSGILHVLPVYSSCRGHVPRSADVVVKPRHINKDLIEDNYRFNVTGYTGVTR